MKAPAPEAEPPPKAAFSHSFSVPPPRDRRPARPPARRNPSDAPEAIPPARDSSWRIHTEKGAAPPAVCRFPAAKNTPRSPESFRHSFRPFLSLFLSPALSPPLTADCHLPRQNPRQRTPHLWQNTPPASHPARPASAGAPLPHPPRGNPGPDRSRQNDCGSGTGRSCQWW